MEDLLGVEGAVILAHACMVPADDQVGAAEVLAEDRVEQSFPGTGVAHIQRITGLDDGVLHEIVLGEDIDGLGAHFRGDVAGFQFAQELVDQDAVADLDGDLGQVLVGAVHGVPELQSGDGVPAFGLKHLPGFIGPHVKAGILLREGSFTPDLADAAQVDRFLVHDHLHARMFHFVSGENLFAFPLFVDFVLIGDLHGPHHLFRLFIHQEHFLADLNGIGLALVDGHGDGDGPEGAVGEFHVAHGTLPVGLVHETIQGGETADAHHDQVGRFPGGQSDHGEFLDPLFFFGYLSRRKQ